jgi:hypothetical protein
MILAVLPTALGADLQVLEAVGSASGDGAVSGAGSGSSGW